MFIFVNTFELYDIQVVTLKEHVFQCHLHNERIMREFV